jgi:hypothetical protein
MPSGMTFPSSTGAVQVGGDASVTNCLFLNNTAIYGAGLNFNDAAVLVVENCNFTSNKAIVSSFTLLN